MTTLEGTASTTGVYFVAAMDPEPRFVKIGMTTDMRQRMLSLATGSPLPLQVVSFVDMAGSSSREIRGQECRFHRRWNDYRATGEWFTVAGELASFMRRRRSIGTRCDTCAGFLVGRSTYIDRRDWSCNCHEPVKQSRRCEGPCAEYNAEPFVPARMGATIVRRCVRCSFAAGSARFPLRKFGAVLDALVAEPREER